MTYKKHLSNKKTSQQTISISPALKDWIQRYVNVQHDQDPEDERYKSVSAFYNTVLEKVLDMFSRGKTLNDMDKAVDSTVSNFYEKFTFNASIPLHEKMLENNRYSNLALNNSLYFLFRLRDFFKKNLKPFSSKSIKIWFERLENFGRTSKLQKLFKIEFKDSTLKSFFVDFVGTEKNLHFENCKINAALIGILGCKVTSILYYPQDLYCRMDFKATDLLYNDKRLRKERISLMNENLRHLINYNRLIQDDDHYLWMKMAEDKDVIINFTNEKVKKKWINLMESEFEKFGENEDFLPNILNFFEKMHWIEIENREVLSFRIRISKEKNKAEIEFLQNYLSKHAKLSEQEGLFYLK